MLPESHHFLEFLSKPTRQQYMCLSSEAESPRGNQGHSLALSNLLLPICEMGIRTYFTLLLQSSHKYWTGKYIQKCKALRHYWLHSCCHRDGCCLGFSLLKLRWPQHKFPGLWLLGQRIWTSLWFLICIAQLPLELWTVTAIVNSNMLFQYV